MLAGGLVLIGLFLGGGVVWGHPSSLLLLFLSPMKKRLSEDQTLPLHCRDLTKKRELKLENKNKILSLLARNRSLWKRAKTRESIRLRLHVNYAALRRQLRLALIQVKTQEDSLVRHGCPG